MVYSIKLPQNSGHHWVIAMTEFESHSQLSFYISSIISGYNLHQSPVYFVDLIKGLSQSLQIDMIFCLS